MKKLKDLIPKKESKYNNALYEEAGWVSIPRLASYGMTFNIIVGSRQIGKTFGCLAYHISRKIPCIFLRRSLSELEFALNDETSVFKKVCRLLDIDFVYSSSSKYTYSIDFTFKDGTTLNWCATALSALSRVRGFSGDPYEEVIYDEYIPEKTVKRMKDEGEAFVNGYLTLAGNRELEGLPPLKVWLLANANDLYSPINEILGLSKKIERMCKDKQEFSCLPERSVLILLAQADKIVEKRSKMAIYKCMGTDNAISRMTLNNEFAYNDFTDIESRDLAQYICKVVYHGHAVWVSKTGCEYYCCDVYSGSPVISDANLFKPGIRDLCENNGCTDFFLAWQTHKVVYASYKEKAFWYNTFQPLGSQR